MDIFRIEDVIGRRGAPAKAYMTKFRESVAGKFVYTIDNFTSPTLSLYKQKEFLRPTLDEYLKNFDSEGRRWAIRNCGLSEPAYEIKMLYPLLNTGIYYVASNEIYHETQCLTTDGNKIFCSGYFKFFTTKNIPTIINLLRKGFCPNDIHTMLAI